MDDLSGTPTIFNPAANEALYAMRHEALPIIERNLLNLEHIDKAPAWKKRIWEWEGKAGIARRFSWWHHYEVNLAALRILGTNSFPVLKRLSVKSDYAVESMGILSRGGGIEEMISLLKSDSSETRMQAAANLSQIPHDAQLVIAPLFQATKDHHRDVAQSSIISLSRLNAAPESVIPYYQKLFQSKDWGVRSIAAGASVNFGTNAQPLVPMLITLLKDDHPEVRSIAAGALQYLHKTHGVSTNGAKSNP